MKLTLGLLLWLLPLTTFASGNSAPHADYAWLPEYKKLFIRGGMDFFNIYNHAQKILHGDAIPIEVHERQGDYYVVPVFLAGKEQKMYFSKVHINYFSALFEYEEY